MQKLACALALAGAVIAGATSVWHVIFGVSQAWLVSGPVLGVLLAALAFAITRVGRAEVPRVLWSTSTPAGAPGAAIWRPQGEAYAQLARVDPALAGDLMDAVVAVATRPFTARRLQGIFVRRPGSTGVEVVTSSWGESLLRGYSSATVVWHDVAHASAQFPKPDEIRVVTARVQHSAKTGVIHPLALLVVRPTEIAAYV
jgi:hypothetical protein